MATSDSIRLISPLRVWLAFNVIFMGLAAASFLGYYRIASRDNERLIVSQEATLSRARLADLQSRRFREFVEGIGREFNDLFIRVDFHNDGYEFGQMPPRAHCAQSEYPLGGAGPARTAKIKMCRPFTPSTAPLIGILLAYVVVSGAALRIAQRLDARAAGTLAAFLRDSGAQVDASDGTVGILRRIQEIIGQLEAAQEDKRRLEFAKTRAELAEQVAHDIRSPLAALQSLTGRLASFPEDEQRLIRAAIDRIGGIAADLLASRPTRVQAVPVIALSRCVSAAVAEKGVQYGDGVAIEGPSVADYGQLHGRADALELGRINSNLIDNAVQAMDGAGTVRVGIRALDDGIIELSIQDSGAGIAADLIPMLGRRGATFGKEKGTGLGLYHAKSTVESWGGRLEIESEVGRGTTVCLIFPRVEAPVPSESAVLLDDDSLVRMNWMLAAKRAGKTLKAYADPGALIKEADSIPKRTPVYIDSDLGNGLKGEDAAKNLAALGFTELHLATGHDPASFPHLPHIKSIRGKEPPWTGA